MIVKNRICQSCIAASEWSGPTIVTLIVSIDGITRNAILLENAWEECCQFMSQFEDCTDSKKLFI